MAGRVVGEAGRVELKLKAFLVIALLSGAGSAVACSHSEIPLTPQQEAASRAADDRMRNHAPKQSMVLIYYPESKGSWAAISLMGVGEWTGMSAADRARFRDNPNVAYDDWWRAHGGDQVKISSAAGAALHRRWLREGKQRWEPVGFGHGYVSGCGGPEWTQKLFRIDHQLATTPRQADGSVLAELYGYKYSDRSNGWQRQFVVLKFHLCRNPFGPSGHCT